MSESKQEKILRYFRHKIAESGRRTTRAGTIQRVAKEAIDDPSSLTPMEYLESRMESDHQGTRDAALRLTCTLEDTLDSLA
ncbi:hypothetical protein [Salinibacter ruber]|uniref:Uncharacterized protein n=1 Tax=Salinibacter ruber TaxID=146919 RepID=A0A9X2Q4S8_9BACT|nr:hypothetical protein [Salinibacter ruber]MCS3661782.1 hypothetical protein [Salinibacter ruber]MCS3711557.1 hypothetical protein [Salinibacter ruber]